MTNRNGVQLVIRWLPGYLLSLLLCGLISCATTARQEVDVATAPAATTTATRIAPPRTPSPPAETPPGSKVSPLQLEPTATFTIAPPTLIPTAMPIPTSSVVPGWLTYENEFLGYSFSYPPEATIGHHGTTEEPPENITTRLEYLAWEETVTPNNLCVGVGYKTGFVTVGPADEPLAGYASPCGITGIGDYTIEEWEEVVTINGKSYTANAMRLYTWQTDQLEHEYYLLRDFNNDLNIDFGLSMRGAPNSARPDLTEAEFNLILETLLQILASFRF